MARRKVPDLKAPKRRKQLALPIPWVAALLIGGLATAGAAAWDARACIGERQEAENALLKILELERKHMKDVGRYAPMAPCYFVEDQSTTCVSRIGFSIIGDSHFAYRVDVDGETFVATAVGISSRHRGSTIRLDHTGALDLSGSTCRE